MLPLERIAALRRVSQAKATAFIEKHGDSPVYIYSRQWGEYWRPGRCGYTYNKQEAGVYTFREAYQASGHCGPEKGICYVFIRTVSPTITN